MFVALQLSHQLPFLISAQLTVIISDDDESYAGFSLSDIPIIKNFGVKIKFHNEDLIKLQHIIINNGKVPECRLPHCCEDKLNGCLHHISATRLCYERQYYECG